MRCLRPSCGECPPASGCGLNMRHPHCGQKDLRRPGLYPLRRFIADGCVSGIFLQDYFGLIAGDHDLAVARGVLVTDTDDYFVDRDSIIILRLADADGSRGRHLDDDAEIFRLNCVFVFHCFEMV